MARIFLVEDDMTVAALLRHSIAAQDHEVMHFTDAEDCLGNMGLRPDIISIDYNLPGMNGIELMQKVREADPMVMVILVSGQESREVIVEAYRKGASDYIIKNDSLHANFANAMENLSANVRLRKEVEVLREQIIDRHKYSSILGNSQAILKVLKLMQKVEKSNIMVLITGQSGTGKELVAKALHYNSNRARKPFVTVNMGAIPEDLVESELFGHEKGAFTDARDRRIGKFEEADGGTIFLDEIGEMTLHLQSKLLRVLQEKEVTRIGSNKTIKLDFRMIAATNRNLINEVKEGRFREDLFYRIQGFLIHLPPLKERGDDVILLAKSFLSEFCINNRMNQPELSRETIAFMLKYEWPGNIRELKAVIERAAVLCENNTITPEDLMFVTA
ncbi:MAG: sigma-54-dependent transcriptional regulator [Bacteroidota bacterium]|jgi:two-component system response regulator AtoC